MADEVKIVFDADLEPLRQKKEQAKKEIDDFVSDSQAKLKDIKGPGDVLGSAGDALTGARDLQSAGSALASTNQAVASSADMAAEKLAVENLEMKLLAASTTAADAALLGILVTVGSVAAAGVGLVLYSTKNKELAEQQLEISENLALSANKRVLGLRDEVSEYQRVVNLMREAAQLSNKIGELVTSKDAPGIKSLRDKTEQDNLAKVTEIARLKADLRSNEQSLAFEKSRPVRQGILTEAGLLPEYTASTKRANERTAEDNLEKTKKQLSAVEEELKAGVTNLGQYDKALQEITKNQDKTLSDSFGNFQKNQEQNRRLAEEQAARFIQSVKEANEKVKGIVRGAKDEIRNLYLGSVSDNPFAQQMIQNANATETLKEKLRGVGPELRKTALGLLETANAAKSYSVQINSAFETVDLRAQGNKFRNPTQKELSEDLANKYREFQRTSNSTNPDVIRQFKREAQDILDSNKVANQRTVDEKLRIAERAKTPEEKAIADRAVTSFAGGLNPDDLTQAERRRIADAFERSAIRNESREIEALTVQKDLLATMKAIDKRGEALTGIVGTRDKNGLTPTTKLDITLRDDTSDKKATAASATNSDVADTYKFPVAGPGGSNL